MADHEDLRFEMDRLVSYDDASLLTEVQRVAAALPRGVISRRAFDAASRVSSSTLVRRFGGWGECLRAAGLGARYADVTVSAKMIAQRGRSLDRDEVIAELRRVASLLGTTRITQAEFVEHSDLIGSRVIRSRFGSWRAAMEAAGLEVVAMGRRWTEDDYFENLLIVWTHYGRPPTYQEMSRSPSRISNSGYAAKFGSWGKAKAAFVERMNSDMELVNREASIPVDSPPVHRTRPEDLRTIPMGLRYQVLKAGRFRCASCGRSPATDLDCVLHVDHVVPFSRGGKTRADNLRALCSQCNLGKGSKD